MSDMFDSLETEMAALRRELDAARRERDIHAADLSAIRIALGVLHAAGREDDAEVAATNLERVIEGAGDARYMERLKAQWQAEILEYLERKSTDHRDPSHPVVPLTEVQRLITEKRRQAEEAAKAGRKG